jgi:hypothetical protein
MTWHILMPCRYLCEINHWHSKREVLIRFTLFSRRHIHNLLPAPRISSSITINVAYSRYSSLYRPAHIKFCIILVQETAVFPFTILNIMSHFLIQAPPINFIYKKKPVSDNIHCNILLLYGNLYVHFQSFPVSYGHWKSRCLLEIRAIRY